ncbi:MAG: hypothetical protein CVU49_09050 [Candidatus Cloacimonetes bacterium HGW-Cloacimonetes-2]|jgi:uncharacterized protein YacL|nr:MAG: hypothetical protein CVU49_09050 [Candidatus Cloacimonetes bacterium HGW-Cloacimonetes-2]
MLLLWILLPLYILLNLLDAISTWLVVKPDKYAQEINPLARWLFIRLGLFRGLLVAETLNLGIFTPLIIILAAFFPVLATILLSLAVLFYAVLVVNNFRIYLRQKRRDT